MTTQTSNPPATTTKWTPRDLIAWSRAERVLRETERRRFGRGTWAVVEDDALFEKIGERVVRIYDVTNSSSVAVCRGTDVRQPPQLFDVGTSKLKACPAFGDPVSGDPVSVGTTSTGVAVLPITTASTKGVVAAFTPNWRHDDQPEVVMLEGPFSPPTSRPKPETTPPAFSAFTSADSAGGSFVRYVHADGTVGPDLTAAMFCEIASSVDPCRPRNENGQTILDNHPRKAVLNGQITFDKYPRESVLCDFAGGATLWIWRDCLVANLTNMFWSMSPTVVCGRHPETAKIFRVNDPVRDARAALADATAALAAIQALNPAPPQQAALSAAAGDKHVTDIISDLYAADRPRRDDIYVLDEDYHDRLELVAKRLREEWTQGQRDVVDLDNVLEDLLTEFPSPGAYVVRSVGEAELPDGKPIYICKAQPVGFKNGERMSLVVGLLRHVSGTGTAIARRGEDEAGLARVGGAVARATKEVGGRALGAVKDVAVGAKDFAVETVTRKGTAIVREVAQDTAVGSANMIRRGIGAAAEEMLGKEKGSIAESPMFRHGFDFASVGALRVGGSWLSKVAPGLARSLSAGADTLEEGLDKEQARAVVETAKPLAAAGFRALAQAAVSKFMPALAAPQPAPAIPETTPEPAPAKPRARRKPATKKTTDESKT